MHYNGWKASNKIKKAVGDQYPFRSNATSVNLFPKEREGELNFTLLKELGMSEKIVKECDAHFFHNLILPVENTAKSYLKKDP
jgi:hypothetical protein